MTTKQRVPAADGWFTLNREPALIGSRCAACGTYFFPKQLSSCRNPHCGAQQLGEVELSRRGTVWSYTVNHYPPPPPAVAPEPFRPYAVAAVELPEERMVVLGQVASDADLERLRVGGEVELTVETLYEDDENEYVVWKWRPVS